MTKKLTLIFVIIFIACNFIHAELPQNSTCGMPSEALQTSAFTNIGGRYISSEGTITALVLFVRFSDDTETTSSWPNAGILPSWAQSLLNPTYDESGNYTSNSLTDYIFQSSYGKLHIIGDVYYVTLPNTEAYYYQNATSSNDCRTKIQQDAFDQLATFNIDLSRYDNWKNLTAGEDFSPDQTPDGNVDLCWFIMRNFNDGVYHPSIFLGYRYCVAVL